MSKSLGSGPSAIVPIRTPEALRDLLREFLRDGETISELTRQLWIDEITRRAGEKKSPKQKKHKSKSG